MFLGYCTNKDPKYVLIVANMLGNKNLGCLMCLKVHFLHKYPEFSLTTWVTWVKCRVNGFTRTSQLWRNVTSYGGMSKRWVVTAGHFTENNKISSHLRIRYIRSFKERKGIEENKHLNFFSDFKLNTKETKQYKTVLLILCILIQHPAVYKVGQGYQQQLQYNWCELEDF